MRSRPMRAGLAIVLALVLVGAVVVALRLDNRAGRNHIVAYFDNSNGLYAGDEVRILGVPVGAIDSIEPQPQRAKVTFWVDDQYQVPADAKAVVISPRLVTSRAIQLTPVYSDGPAIADGAVIPQERTAVPLEWDDLRVQLEKLTDALQPTEPGGVSSLGAFVNTAADNLRGQGAEIRDTITKMSQAFSVLGDHSDDIFATVKNLSVVVSALEDSSSLMRQLNVNLSSVTALLAEDPDAVGNAINDLNSVVGDATQFIRDNRDALGTTTDRLASISGAVHGSLDQIKQALHVFPNAAQNFANVYQPAQGALTGILAVNNLADPITFLCGAIEAASRVHAEQSSKLCVQYLAPIVKNRQMNFPPVGVNPFVGAAARPNEIDYSEDWLRPGYVPAQATAPPPAEGTPQPPASPVDNPATGNTTQATDPDAGLPGMLIPSGGGS